jgi:hypothetical protein
MNADDGLAELRTSLMNVISADGDCGPGWAAQLADVAIRRWNSFDRRNKAKHPTAELRIRDLVRGLRQGYPGELIYVAPGSLEWLARELSEILARDAGHRP